METIYLMNYYCQQGKKKNKLRNAFENKMSTDIELSKTQVSKIIQSGRFLGSLLSKIAVPLAKKYFSSIRNNSCCLAIDSGIQNKAHGSGTTTLIISNEEMKDIIVQALEDSKILLKGITKTIEYETNNKKKDF